MKIGDKVRFLNDVGGGIVKRFIGKDQVGIEDEDGFEIPTLIKDCIVVDTDDYNMEKQSEPEAKDIPAKHKYYAAHKPEMAPEKGFESVAAAYGMAAKNTANDKVNAMLAFIPSDIKALSSSSYDMYIINDCSFRLYYVILSSEGLKWRTRFSGVIEPDTKMYLDEIDKSNLDELDPLIAEIIPFKEGVAYEYKPAVTAQIKIDLVKFYKLNAFVRTDYFEEPALLQKIIDNDNAVKPINVDADNLKEEILSKKHIEEHEKPQPARKVNPNEPLEINLHIDSLLDSTNGMNNKEMLDYQMKTFNEVMQSNLQNKERKIVFIHGKGNGVLRQQILQELKHKYKTCTWQDASFQQYGFGATLVTIH